jgi:hypothetical protein
MARMLIAGKIGVGAEKVFLTFCNTPRSSFFPLFFTVEKANRFV